MEKENREHKDSLFVDLFYQDETAKKNLLSLYNALHDTNYEDETIIRKVKIDDVLYKNFKNDISCEVNGLVLVFGEHQSTINRNMPLRCLMYVGRAYEQLVDSKARYRTTLVKIPTPEFYVFYNGEKEQPLEQVLTLSDAFMNPVGENSVELKVKVININSDKAHGILDKCGILREYSQFISMVRKYSEEESAIKKAIKECIEKGILADYLKRKGSEVENMLIAEYSYEEDMQVKLQEGIWQGITLSADIFQMVKKNPDLANVQIAENLGCSVEDVESTRKMFGI
ncbi:Rpn family recombination-promoting nuclease/putative transposase [Sporofaciens musculi]|uniref:Rpn family recombination-promoting nuclease/putative transposase n=1 Tax=Sporofaciens musculi TaxID=2681861 RepID=UPI00259C9908|nr:Rpn family recombination-promoting nuclease/putative transposase [Sporofaciens musculi]